MTLTIVIPALYEAAAVGSMIGRHLDARRAIVAHSAVDDVEVTGHERQEREDGLDGDEPRYPAVDHHREIV